MLVATAGVMVVRMVASVGSLSLKKISLVYVVENFLPEEVSSSNAHGKVTYVVCNLAVEQNLKCKKSSCYVIPR